MTDFDTALSAAAQRLMEAKKLALLREMEIEVARKHGEIAWRAEYEPVVRKVAYDTAHWMVAEVSQWLLTEDEVRERLADVLRERHAVADPLASEIVATVRSVLSELVTEIKFGDEPDEDSDAGPLVP